MVVAFVPVAEVKVSLFICVLPLKVLLSASRVLEAAESGECAADDLAAVGKLQGRGAGTGTGGEEELTGTCERGIEVGGGGV